jgi:hypothetical protein
VSTRLARVPGARIGMRYLCTSLGFWVLFHLGTLLWHQHFNFFYFREPYILALTHLAALGWLTTGLMGVMYTTLPATLGVRPHSVRMARLQYWLQVVGILGLVLTMSLLPNARGRVMFGLLTLGALVIFVHNIAATVGRGKEWRLPEAHFVMAVFYLAVTGLIGVSYVFYLNSGLIPQTMVSLKVHAHFAALGWLALPLMGLTYKLLPLEMGLDRGPQHWSLAASVLINLVFWGVFFSYAYDSPLLRVIAAMLGLAGLLCHTLQVRAITRGVSQTSRWFESRRTQQEGAKDQAEDQGGGGEARFASVPYTQASCVFGIAATLLAILLTTGAVGENFAVEYAYAYAGGVGWFGLYISGQMAWLIPLLLRDEARQSAPEPQWIGLEFPAQVAGTALVTAGLLAEISLLVALGAGVNLAASLLMTVRSVRLYWAQPAIVEK